MKRINKVITLIATFALTLAMTTNVYADALNPPFGSDGGSLTLIIIVLIAVGIAVFFILKEMHDKKRWCWN